MASRPSIRTPECARSTGSSISTRPRRCRRERPTICGTTSARVSRRERSRSISTGRAGRPSSTIRSRRRPTGNVGIIVAADRHRRANTSGWSGSHGLSVTEACDSQGRGGLARLVAHQRRQPEDRGRQRLAADPHAVWEWDIAQAANDPYKKQVLATFQEFGDILRSRCRRSPNGSRSPTSSILSCRRRFLATRPRRPRSTQPPTRRLRSCRTPASSEPLRLATAAGRSAPPPGTPARPTHLRNACKQSDERRPPSRQLLSPGR